MKPRQPISPWPPHRSLSYPASRPPRYVHDAVGGNWPPGSLGHGGGCPGPSLLSLACTNMLGRTWQGQLPNATMVVHTLHDNYSRRACFSLGSNLCGMGRMDSTSIHSGSGSDRGSWNVERTHNETLSGYHGGARGGGLCGGGIGEKGCAPGSGASCACCTPHHSCPCFAPYEEALQFKKVPQ